jgi:hypothetical protein
MILPNGASASSPASENRTQETPDNSPAMASEAVARKDSLIDYPSLFPIKVMSVKVDGLVAEISAIAHQFDPAFDATTIELRESKGGKYLGVTITVMATSREQLDDLYRALFAHPMVKVVL